LLPGGILILSEKFRFADDQEQERLEQVHYAFKRANGYSDLEIAQKRSAIENVMLLDTPQIHLSRLEQAGFSQAYSWFQCFNFGSIVAHAWSIIPRFSAPSKIPRWITGWTICHRRWISDWRMPVATAICPAGRPALPCFPSTVRPGWSWIPA